MSLTGALNIGQSALAVSQAALQVTGNNIANASDPNYSEEVAVTNPLTSEQITPSIYIGTGVDLTSIQRQVDESLNGRLNSSISDNQAASTLQSGTGEIQTAFNALGSNGLDTQFTNFLNDWSTLAGNPTNTAQRQVVIQDGTALAQQINSLGTQLGTQQSNLGTQLSGVVGNVNQLTQQIASLNTQIVASQGQDNSLADQRDTALQSLAKLVNIQTINQSNGTVNVFIGSSPVVLAASANTMSVSQSVVNGQPTYSLNFTNGEPVQATSGQLGGLLGTQTQVNGTVEQLNTLAGGLISGLNNIFASGQGLSGFSTVTGTTQDLDPTAALNSTSAGLAFPPQNGSFVVTLTNTSTGLASSTLVPVNLTGSSSDTTLNSLTSSLNAISGVQASVNGGKLTIASSNPGETITFSQDSSNTLAALGINTFFQGSNAQTIAVNSTVASNTEYLNAAQNGDPGDNTNALAISNFAGTPVSSLNGSSWIQSYNSMIDQIGTSAQTAQNNATSTQDVMETLQNQQQSVSGVNINDEAINMIQQQRNFQGAAQFVNTVNQMMQTLLNITID